LIADDNNDEGIEMLQAAFNSGYTDTEPLLELSKDARVNKVHQEQIRSIVDKIIAKQQTASGDTTGNTESNTDSTANENATNSEAPQDTTD
jgi:hypothetical protein